MQVEVLACRDVLAVVLHYYLSAGLAAAGAGAAAGAAEGAAKRSPSSSCSSSKSRLAARGLAFSACCLGLVILNRSSSSSPSSNRPPNLGFGLLKINHSRV